MTEQGGQILAQTIVEISRLGLFAYAVAAARQFLLRWLDTRQGQSLFATPRLVKKEDVLDGARHLGITDFTVVETKK